MRPLDSEYLWPRIGLRRPPVLDDGMWEMVQPVISRTTEVMRLQHRAPLGLMDGGARDAGVRRRRVDVALAALLAAAQAVDSDAVRMHLVTLGRGLDDMEKAAMDVLARPEDGVKPKRTLIV